MSSLLTVKQKVLLAQALETSWIANNDTYVGIGSVIPWTNNTPPVANNSTDSDNYVFDNLVALKKLTAADFNLVIPRVDWTSGTTYVPYDNQVDMFTYTDYDQANGTIALVSSNNTIIGTGTTFNLDFAPGQFLSYMNVVSQSFETKEVVSVVSSTQILVNTGPSFTTTSTTPYNYSSTFPYYYNNFYVRNSYDQVFKCLFNGSNNPNPNQNQCHRL